MSGKYISIELERAMYEVATHRSLADKIKESEKIYKILKEDIKASDKIQGECYITNVLDRNIGKSYAIAKLAIEYGMPIILHNEMCAKYIKREIREEFGVDVETYGVNSNLTALQKVYLKPNNFILKDEGFNLELLKDRLARYGIKNITIIGIE